MQEAKNNEGPYSGRNYLEPGSMPKNPDTANVEAQPETQGEATEATTAQPADDKPDGE